MNLKKVLKIILVVIFALFQVYLFFFKKFEVQDYCRYINEFPLPLADENKEVCQEFRTPGPLARIDIMMANYKIKPKGGTLRLSIFNKKFCGGPGGGFSKEPPGELLYLKNYSANTIEDNRFFSCRISPKSLPVGSYSFQLDYFPQDKKDRLAVWTTTNNLYPYGDFYVNGRRCPGDMTFRVYYLASLWQTKDLWLAPVPRAKFRSIVLIFGFIAFIVLVNGFFVYFSCKL